MRRKMAIIFLPILIMSLIINIHFYKKNNAYEQYLSEELNNLISPLSRSILENELILRQILDKKIITSEQAKILSDNYEKLGFNYESIRSMGIKTNKVSRDEISSQPTTELRVRLTYFFDSFNKVNSTEQNYELNQEQYNIVVKIAEMTFEFSTAVHENIKGATPNGMTEEYWSNPSIRTSINKTYWISLLEEIDKISHHYFRLLK